MNYAIIENGKVENVAESESALYPNWIYIGDQPVGIGWLYDGSSFSAPPDSRRHQVKITGIMKNGITPIPLSNRAVINKSESLGVTARFQTADGELLLINDTFGMPIYQLGGIVEQTIGVQFIDGTAQMLVDFEKSGEYVVTSEGLNLHLPNDQKLDFETFYISVLK
jgi:hypothetical protein